MQALVLFLELFVDDAEVAAAIRAQMTARILALFAVPEAGAEDACDALVPGQLHEGLRVGQADQLRRFRAIADIVLAAIDEEIGGRPVDELEALFRNCFPMVGGNALADNAAGDRNELIVDVFDTECVDLGAYLFDEFFAPFLCDVCLKVSHLTLSLLRRHVGRQ